MTFIDTTSAFRGFTAPVKELIDEIHKIGWTVGKVTMSGDEYKATAKSPDRKESMTGRGPNENSALGHLLMSITRFHSLHHAAKLASWDTEWIESLDEVAQAYAEAPIYDPKAVSAWKELADDNARRAKVIGREIQVEMVNTPTPYLSVNEMIEDVSDKAKIKISTISTEHPVWSTEQVLNFRLVHNVVGHCVAGEDWGWRGENLATAAHMALLDPTSQKALFTETIGRTAFTAYYGVSVSKIAILDDQIEEAQGRENKPGWGGSHPSQTVIPANIPSVEKDASVKYASDPNTGWRSLVDPLPTNAYLWDRDEQGRDPLNLPALRDNSARMDSGWTDLARADGSPDVDSQKQAVANAFRAILMAPRKSLQDATVHYRDISHIPASVDDPIRYWKALDGRRDEHNQTLGLPPGLHLQSWDEEKRKFRSWIKGLNPDLSDESVHTEADRQLFHMIAEEEERIERDKPDSSAAEIEEKVMKAIKKRLNTLTKSKYDEKHDFGDELARFGSVGDGVYPSFLVSRTKPIAGVSHHLEEVYKAALEDAESGGTGHSFRNEVVNLEIPGIGPMEASYAWSMLAPNTSELAIIDEDTADILGYKEAPSDRDYFKAERQLAAGRDAAGYGHIPLNQFSTGMWNNKKYGPGVHSDYSPLRSINPTQADSYPDFTDQWEEPEWWKETQEARDMIGKHWDRTIAPAHPSDTIPKLGSAAFTPQIELPTQPYPYFVGDDGVEQRGESGATLMRYMRDVLGLSTPEIWNLQMELGKRND